MTDSTGLYRVTARCMERPKKAGKTLGVGLLIPGNNCRSHRDPTPVFTVESDDSTSTVPYFGPCVGEPSEYYRDESVQPLGQ